MKKPLRLSRTVISLIFIRLNLNSFFISLNCLLKLIWTSVSNPYIAISLIIRLNLNGIDEKSLFQDIYGFSMVNDVNHPIYKKTAEEYFLEGNQDFYKLIWTSVSNPYIAISLIIRLNLNGFFISLNCLLKLIWTSVSNPYIVISLARRKKTNFARTKW
jgi:hypothetical protein